MKDIRTLVRTLAGDPDFIESVGVPCTVKSVSGITCECEPVNGDAPFLGVRLQAGGDEENGILMVPKVGSVVIVQPINETTGYVAMFSEVESIKFLDGSYGGLIKIADLVTKVNNLENQLNSVLASLQGVVIPLAPSGTYPFAPLFTQTPLTPTVPADIENNKITHGTI